MSGICTLAAHAAAGSCRRTADQSQPAVPSHSRTASVAGTTWAGTDSDGDYYEYHFQPDGALHYKSPAGFYKNGTWKQGGNAIYMETNNKYAERQGRISGRHMKGNAWNVKLIFNSIKNVFL